MLKKAATKQHDNDHQSHISTNKKTLNKQHTKSYKHTINKNSYPNNQIIWRFSSVLGPKWNLKT